MITPDQHQVRIATREPATGEPVVSGRKLVVADVRMALRAQPITLARSAPSTRMAAADGGGAAAVIRLQAHELQRRDERAVTAGGGRYGAWRDGELWDGGWRNGQGGADRSATPIHVARRGGAQDELADR